MEQKHIRTQEFLASLVIELMADQKERTSAEILAEIHATPDQIRRTLKKLTYRSEIHVYGFVSGSHARIYRVGIGRQAMTRRSAESPPRPLRDPWITADPVLNAAMSAMVRVRDAERTDKTSRSNASGE
ncbi:hypothetical protein [Burkholderia cepacia]|uniref:hypothetical protein n=1 Tax=Burkholderia cepacia TaxID=292 RepID=UPI0012D8E358|nr:hypothetical protein [Burkholderia cepacia]